MPVVKSWKTTALGVLTILAAVSNAAMALLDADPATNPNWEITLGLIMAGIAAIFAKDANVSNAPSPGPAQNVVKTP